MKPILITGSSGLVGSALRAALVASGETVRGLDLRTQDDEHGDVRDDTRMQAAIAGCGGVVHLAAVSRVTDGERDPAECRSINVGGVSRLIEVARRQPEPPWLVFASSREVYGQAASLPVSEDAPLRPLNVYGETKVRGEEMIQQAREHGLETAILRLSNVYGGMRDHADRVVPAFVRGAIANGELRVDGADHTFDFTYLDDTVAALLAAIGRIATGLPPLHVLTGQGTTLGQLAALAIELAGGGRVVAGPERSFDVARFVGDPSRATRVLGWSARTSLREGLARMIAATKAS